MPANDHLHPQQLKLFMSGTEWQSSVSHSADRNRVPGPPEQIAPNVFKPTERRETMGEMWERKESESRARSSTVAQGGGLYNAIRDEGYDHDAALYERDKPTLYVHTNPDQFGHGLIQGEGHHRIAAAAAVERDHGKVSWIPTTYREA